MLNEKIYERKISADAMHKRGSELTLIMNSRENSIISVESENVRNTLSGHTADYLVSFDTLENDGNGVESLLGRIDTWLEQFSPKTVIIRYCGEIKMAEAWKYAVGLTDRFGEQTEVLFTVPEAWEDYDGGITVWAV